jgi:uncharacterized membrane protein YfcA
MTAGLLLAALARGYSGFGFSALLVASWSLVVEPSRAVALALVMEVVASVMQAFSVWRLVPWKRVGLLTLGALLGTPAGVWLLATQSAERMKLGVALFVLIAAGALLAGFRFKRQATPTGTASVGVVSGVANGAVAMGGLPVAVFLAAEGGHPAQMRAALIAYFFLLDIYGLCLLAEKGIAGPATFADALIALPIVAVGIWYGTRRFAGTTPQSFRRTTLWILIGLGVIGIARAML